MLLLTFRAAGTLHAVDVARVAEVIPRVDLRRIPHAPAYLAGLFDYRGQVVPVIDLAVLLGHAPCADRLSTRIILVEGQERERMATGHDEAAEEIETPRPQRAQPRRRELVGVIAEHVSDVAQVGAEQVISPSMSLPQAPYLGAIVAIANEMVQLIVPDRLLDDSMRRALFGAPDAEAGSTPRREGAR
jgi:chemotaxis-related protein WspB